MDTDLPLGNGRGARAQRKLSTMHRGGVVRATPGRLFEHDVDLNRGRAGHHWPNPAKPTIFRGLLRCTECPVSATPLFRSTHRSEGCDFANFLLIVDLGPRRTVDVADGPAANVSTHGLGVQTHSWRRGCLPAAVAGLTGDGLLPTLRLRREEPVRLMVRRVAGACWDIIRLCVEA